MFCSGRSISRLTLFLMVHNNTLLPEGGEEEIEKWRGGKVISYHIISYHIISYHFAVQSIKMEHIHQIPCEENRAEVSLDMTSVYSQ